MVVAGIFARGGSKGVPRKNVRMVGGKPLLAHAIQTARSSTLIDRVFVSTEDAEIAEIASRYGAEVPFMRPAELAGDETPEWAAWQHAVRTLRGDAEGWDAFVCVPPTSPLRTVHDVDACIQALLSSGADIAITVRPAERSPHFNMVTLDGDGYARLVIPPSQETFRRQDAPVVYDITTVAYAMHPAFLLTSTSMFKGKVTAVVVPTERALDIDSEFDFRVAECLLQQETRRG